MQYKSFRVFAQTSLVQTNIVLNTKLKSKQMFRSLFGFRLNTHFTTTLAMA